jgi:hypothetical protein
LPPELGAVDPHAGEEVGAAERPVRAPRVVELHRKGVGGPLEELLLDDQRQREAPPAPGGHGPRQRIEDVARDGAYDDDGVHVGGAAHPIVGGRAPIEADAHEVVAERPFDLGHEARKVALEARVGSRHRTAS